MRTLMRRTLTALMRRLQRWQQARAFRAEWHYHTRAVQADVARHTWE